MTSALREPAITLPYRLFSPEQIRELEQRLASALPGGLYDLMEQAGAALDTHLQQQWPQLRLLWICCGQGNNGGDGYVLARLAQARGITVRLFALGVPKAGSEAEQAWRRWLAVRGEVHSCPAESEYAAEQPDLLVDALLGIGPESELRGAVVAWIDDINRRCLPVLAVDLPSGLHAQSGAVLGVAIRASQTLCLVGWKPGLLTGQGPELTGQLTLCSLGAEAQVAGLASPPLQRVDYLRARSWLRPRSRTAHKGSCGRLLVLGGGPGMPGAIRLAAEAALRGGAGLVKVVTCAEHQATLLAGCPELMCQESPTMASDHAALAAWASIRVLGPGLGLGAWSRSLWQQQLALPGPLVLDADGLTLLAEFPCRREDWILTPHPGEAARLLGCSVAEVERDRLHAVRQLQQRYGGVILLKGAGTLIADTNCVWVCQEGNPGMASGGMGDLLSGIIGALWGQGLPQAVAAWVGACVHGEAGDLAAELGERGMLASDLLPFIRRLVNPAESSG